MEDYKQIPGYENYAISRRGEVKNLKTGKILKGTLPSPYIRYHLPGKVFGRSVLMAMTYMNHMPNGIDLVVDHINGNKTDDRLENLQIITQRENVIKAIKRDLPTGVYEYTKNRYRVRITYNKKLHTIGIFNTPEEAHLAYLAAIPQ